jgi:hypothetical protein
MKHKQNTKQDVAFREAIVMSAAFEEAHGKAVAASSAN